MASHSYPHGLHYQQRARSAHALREQAAEMSEDIANLNHWICERADRFGWDDSMVQSGCSTVERLERERDQLIVRAREVGTAFFNV